MGAVIGVFAQLGDLAESRLKRATGVKDAGSILPGHGGFLDRLDSIVFTLPVVYYLVALVLKSSG
jgi:phosphatidate cytidylyltransferase